MMSLFSTRGIVLKSSPFRQVDRLVTIYTLDFGKSTFLLKGGLKIESKLAGHLEPLSLSEITWVKGRYFNQLTGASLITPFYSLRNDLNKLLTSFYALDILDKFTSESEKEPLLFYLLLDFLNHLEGAEKVLKLKIFLVAFQMKFLDLIGFSPNLSFCHLCHQRIKLNEPVFFDFLEQSVVHQKCLKNKKGKIKISSDEIKLLKLFRREKFDFWEKRTISQPSLVERIEKILDPTFSCLLQEIRPGEFLYSKLFYFSLVK